MVKADCGVTGRDQPEGWWATVSASFSPATLSLESHAVIPQQVTHPKPTLNPCAAAHWKSTWFVGVAWEIASELFRSSASLLKRKHIILWNNLFLLNEKNQNSSIHHFYHCKLQWSYTCFNFTWMSKRERYIFGSQTLNLLRRRRCNDW